MGDAMFFWERPLGLRVFGLSPEFAKASRALAANQGLHNGFLVAGGAGGYALGAVIGRSFYRAPERQVVVVKLDPGAMQPALQAGLIGGICSGGLTTIVPFLLLADGRTLVQHLWIGLVARIVIGVAAAYTATRP